MLATNKEYRHQWYMKNRSRLLEKAKEYTKTHKEEVADYRRKWRQQHPNYNREYMKVYFAQNEDKIIERNKENYKRIRSDPLRWARYLLQSRERRRRYFEKHGEEARARHRKLRREHYQRHKTEELSHQRMTNLHTKGGRVISNVKKRPFPNNVCEICGRQQRRLAYHHWNDSDIAKGIWICCPCHSMAEGIDKGLHDVYLFKKNAIETQATNKEQPDLLERALEFKQAEATAAHA